MWKRIQQLPKKIWGIFIFLFLWLSQGLWENWVFPTMADLLKSWGADLGLVTFIEQHSNFIVPTFAILGIFLIVIWAKKDLTKRNIEQTETIKFNQPGELTKILQGMDDCLWRLSEQALKKKVDLSKYGEVESEINKNIIGVVPSKVTEIEKIGTSFNDSKKQIVEKYSKYRGLNDKQRFQKLFPILNSASLLMDARGLGLKNEREHSNQYHKLNRKLRDYRNYVADPELNNLIKTHADYAEVSANFNLFIHRLTNNKVLHEGKLYEVSEIIPTEYVVFLEGLNKILQEKAIELRTDINNRILLLNRGRDNIIPKSNI